MHRSDDAGRFPSLRDPLSKSRGRQILTSNKSSAQEERPANGPKMSATLMRLSVSEVSLSSLKRYIQTTGTRGWGLPSHLDPSREVKP